MCCRAAHKAVDERMLSEVCGTPSCSSLKFSIRLGCQKWRTGCSSVPRIIRRCADIFLCPTMTSATGLSLSCSCTVAHLKPFQIQVFWIHRSLVVDVVICFSNAQTLAQYLPSPAASFGRRSSGFSYALPYSLIFLCFHCSARGAGNISQI